MKLCCCAEVFLEELLDGGTLCNDYDVLVF